MKRVTQFEFYSLGYLRTLGWLQPGGLARDRLIDINNCRATLHYFINEESHKEILTQTIELAKSLAVTLDRFTQQSNSITAIENPFPWVDGAGRITEYAASSIQESVALFESMLRIELDALPTYIIEKVGIYDMDGLLTKADNVIAKNLKQLIPEETLNDLQRGGACLAFELHTASGFHNFRAVDAMLRRYCEHFVGSLPKRRDWGAFIETLRKIIKDSAKDSARVPNSRTIEFLDRVRDIDRNPLIHPEANLDHTSALTAFNICRSAIELMALDIQDTP